MRAAADRPAASRDLGQRRAHAWGRAPGTWGELVQGELANGRRFLLGLPSVRGAVVVVAARRRRWGRAPVVAPPTLAKTGAAVALLLDRLGIDDTQLHLRAESPLARGVGHASSSADILAALSATRRLLRLSLSDAALCQLAACIEPTNPTLLAGACWFDPDGGQLLGRRPMPGVAVRPLVVGGAVDTRLAARTRPPWTPAQRRSLQQAVDQAQLALSTGSPRLLAAAATRSALLHAERQERADIVAAWGLAREQGALGIAASHSGSGVVALYPPAR